MIISELLSAVLQVLIFTLLPFLFFFIRTKTAKGFFNDVGLYQPMQKSVYLSILASLIFIAATLSIVFINPDFKEVMMTPPSTTGNLRALGFGLESMTALLIIAGFKTSLAEEILFRGLVAKKLIAKLGYAWGNLTQAFVFALVHVALFGALSHAGTPFLIFIFLVSGLGAWIVVYINDKIGNASIVPGWIAHGLGNAISYFVIAFLL